MLRVPSAALRFKPTEEALEALGSGNSAAAANQGGQANVNTVWRIDGGLHPVRVQTGISDGTFTEVLASETNGDTNGANGALEVGTPVAIRLAVPNETGTTTSRPSGNPLMASPGRRF